MNLRDIVLSEIRQTQKKNTHDLTFKWDKKTFKYTEAESTVVDTEAERCGKWGDVCPRAQHYTV